MSTPPPQRAVRLDVDPDVIAGYLHVPASTPHPTAVLIAPPWGWDAVASYRSLRAWAQQLAAAGYVTLRFDLPATGDSGGAPGDAGRLEAWVGAIAAAADWLRGASGCDRIATIGLGFGGLLAGTAVAGGARIEDLVLWAAPARGRSFVREQRAFSQLQAARLTVGGGPEPSGLPGGWLEAAGFVLSLETIAALDALDLRARAPAGLERALLLTRDGTPVDAGLRSQLEDAGVDMTDGEGEGWAAMVAHPEYSAPPLAVFAGVTRWLARAPAGAAPPRLRSAPAAGTGVVASHGNRVRESPFAVPTPRGCLDGVLAQPLEPSSRGLCAVFLNAGAVRHTGPNRLWVEASRRWAASGVPALRIDLDGIGDSDGDAERFHDVVAFYASDLVDEVLGVLDALEARGLGDRFVLTGLCSGGYWAYQAALRDTRVSAAVLVNAAALEWEDRLLTQREARKVARLHELGWWRRILRGDVTRARIRAVAGAYARSAIAQRPPPEPDVDAGFDRLQAAGTRLVLAFSGDDPLHAELEAGGVLARLERWPDIELELLPGHDHTLRPVPAQRALHALLDRQLTHELARAGGCASGAGSAAAAHDARQA